MGFPGDSDGKESACIVGDLGSVPGLGRSHGVGNGYLSSILLGKFHGQRSLIDYSPWDCKEPDRTERITHTYKKGKNNE